MVEINVKELLDDRFEKCDYHAYMSVKFYDICAKDFLDFAMEDSKGGDLRCMVNALGNVKRAIECRVDTILYSYCLYKKSEAEKWSFPKKIEILEHLGIIAPRILKKINRKRNELEHQYIEPTRDEVEDALDVAILFLAYTERFVTKSTKSYGYRNDFEIKLEIEKGIVELTDKKKKVTQKAKIDNDDGWIDFAKRLSGIEIRP